MKNTKAIENAAALLAFMFERECGDDVYGAIHSSFINGAISDAAREFHQEGMYSEDEVKVLIKKAIIYKFENMFINVDTWFERNKKKS